MMLFMRVSPVCADTKSADGGAMQVNATVRGGLLPTTVAQRDADVRPRAGRPVVRLSIAALPSLKAHRSDAVGAMLFGHCQRTAPRSSAKYPHRPSPRLGRWLSDLPRSSGVGCNDPPPVLFAPGLNAWHDGSGALLLGIKELAVHLPVRPIRGIGVGIYHCRAKQAVQYIALSGAPADDSVECSFAR